MNTQPNSDRELAEKISNNELARNIIKLATEGFYAKTTFKAALADVERMIEEHLSPERAAKDAEIAQLKASIAVKDEVLQALREFLRNKHGWQDGKLTWSEIEPLQGQVAFALSTNPGAKLLEELSAAKRDSERLANARHETLVVLKEREEVNLDDNGEWYWTACGIRIIPNAAISRKDENEKHTTSDDN